MRMSGRKSRALHEIVADPWGHADRCMNVVADRPSCRVCARSYAVHDHDPPDPGIQMPNDAALHPVGQDIDDDDVVADRLQMIEQRHGLLPLIARIRSQNRPEGALMGPFRRIDQRLRIGSQAKPAHGKAMGAQPIAQGLAGAVRTADAGSAEERHETSPCPPSWLLSQRRRSRPLARPASLPADRSVCVLESALGPGRPLFASYRFRLRVALERPPSRLPEAPSASARHKTPIGRPRRADDHAPTDPTTTALSSDNILIAAATSLAFSGINQQPRLPNALPARRHNVTR